VKDWLRLTHWLEDTAIDITNAILVAYDGATTKLKDDPDGFVKLVSEAMDLYFEKNVPIPEDERWEIQKAFRSMKKASRRDNLELQDVRRQHEQLLQKSTSNVRLSRKNDLGEVKRSLEPFTKFQNFDTLAFGHFHKPRHTTAKDIFDSGGYVDNVETSLEIRGDGTIERGTGRPLSHAEPSLE
jgi:hypothetical protein